MKSVSVLVTGASGFVGKSLCAKLQSPGHAVFAAVRSKNPRVEDFEKIVVGSIDSKTDWSAALCNMDVVVHLAARVHVMAERSENPLAEFRKVNVEGTRHLAECVARAGVKRFVYVSSVKVNGEQTASPYTELDKPNPQDPYGVSKWEAEQALLQVAARTGLEVVIVRPPLVYGAGVKGNFAQMIKALAKRIPLPLAAVRNLRSLIYVENLVDALILCSIHPKAAGQTYLVSDGEDVSTSSLLRRLGEAMGRPARLFSCPPALLKLVGKLTGKSDQVDRLLGSLQVDSSKIRRELGWQPPFTLDEGLKATAKAIIDKV
ncbi:MAG TPA: SDR family oxidoreductase [Methylotenera sp.]|nr:SDR family oxidoreductase [Methylotenera sp.]